ncbi:potassium uptake transporter, transmembrane subunit, TrkH [Oceanicola granulosus HTCC2516]|uniref:Potassium uptake transporter, transmembrane subunit, TrkH n=1 Tax=Oceanicola granulosus (strain ATCC BAA-861 / DSM 15982 / KCTC 12143 / HTCC2516) TaxID=314256 RepID=Q2CHZ3_OCEGH|nr:potassium transporter TrkG [Oceanicola granulosus]EAR52151.1 potassium uptake transporter, transmembrane subunit, TrkH [Oceanicola granulosus HTCC2516]
MRVARTTARPRQPLFVVLMWFGSAAMLIPAAHGYAVEAIREAQTFLGGALLFLIGSGIVALALRGRRPDESAFSQLATLLAAFVVLPLAFALPFWIAQPQGTLFDAWFEMVSSFTTTGATLYDPARLPDTLHVWRAVVGWLGGLLVWIAAMAVFAPLSLGGFEVRASVGRRDMATRFAQVTRTAGPYERLDRYFTRLAPIYTSLTLALWLGLILSGQSPFHGFVHALSVMATSGISASGGLGGAGGSVLGEVLILGFLVLALSRRTYSWGLPGESGQKLRDDHEFRLGMLILGLSASTLFVRHWIGSDDGADPANAFAALWGGLFTAASFLTTLGLESRYWSSATLWSGLETPGLVLIGLAIFGGGIGTTAGGVKLLRVHALYHHGRREIERLVHPNSVGGQGPEARRIRREGAMIAWVFFMLFAMSIAALMLAVTLTGVDFEGAMVLAVAAVTNCGPLARIGAEVPIPWSEVPEAARAVLAAGMVLGRLELLAIIALLNPDLWRG